MTIEETLDLMDEALDKAWSLPLSGGRCVVDVERMRDLIDDIRVNLPGEIMQAQSVVADRGEILAGAKREGDQLVRKAEERVKAMISQEMVVKQAQAKAADIMTQAQTKSRELRQASQEFSDDALRSTEEALAKALTDLRATRQAIRNSARQR